MNDIPAWVAQLYAEIKESFMRRRAKTGSSRLRPEGIQIVEPSHFLHYTVYTYLGLFASFLPLFNKHAPGQSARLVLFQILLGWMSSLKSLGLT